jgi:hypothetical protein
LNWGIGQISKRKLFQDDLQTETVKEDKVFITKELVEEIVNKSTTNNSFSEKLAELRKKKYIINQEHYFDFLS